MAPWRVAGKPKTEDTKGGMIPSSAGCGVSQRSGCYCCLGTFSGSPRPGESRAAPSSRLCLRALPSFCLWAAGQGYGLGEWGQCALVGLQSVTASPWFVMGKSVQVPGHHQRAALRAKRSGLKCCPLPQATHLSDSEEVLWGRLCVVGRRGAGSRQAWD